MAIVAESVLLSVAPLKRIVMLVATFVCQIGESDQTVERRQAGGALQGAPPACEAAVTTVLFVVGAEVAELVLRLAVPVAEQTRRRRCPSPRLRQDGQFAAAQPLPATFPDWNW